MDARVPASVVSDLIARATWESGLSKHVAATGATRRSHLGDPEPEYMQSVCNPLTGELFRLPDIKGTKRSTMFPGCRNTGLFTCSDAGHGPPNSYVVAVLCEDSNSGAFNMRRFLLQTIPALAPMADKHAVEFAGQLWWLDLTWDIVSADPFNDRLELDFVELPRNSVCLEPNTNIIQEQGMHRRLVVSEGRLRYIELF
uniref:DUF1618 domain-containing protein n=1 Tax=Oryza meridionalis TaxID=40149 RepID=A0A0E0DNU8_9ORYZ